MFAALGQMPEVFDKEDLLRVLPMKPHRSTLYRVLDDLEYKHKLIVLAQRGSGSTPTRYRKVAPSEPSATG